MAFQAPSSRSDCAEERAFGAISPSQWHSRIVAFLINGLWSFKWFTQIGEKLFNAPNSTVVPFHLPLPAVLMRIFYQFLFNPVPAAQPGCVCRRGHELGAGEIQITLTV